MHSSKEESKESEDERKKFYMSGFCFLMLKTETQEEDNY